MPNAVVMQSVPPDSIVEVPAVTIRPRRAHAANPLRSIGPSVPAPGAPAQANNPPAERSVA